MFAIVPCLLGFVFGWAISNRWLARTATILVWGLFFLPLAAASSIGWGSERTVDLWLPFLGLLALSLLLAEAGFRLRARHQAHPHRRSPDPFANS